MPKVTRFRLKYRGTVLKVGGMGARRWIAVDRNKRIVARIDVLRCDDGSTLCTVRSEDGNRTAVCTADDLIAAAARFGWELIG